MTGLTFHAPMSRPRLPRNRFRLRPERRVRTIESSVTFTRVTVFAVGLAFIAAEHGLTPPYPFSGIVPGAPFLWNVVFLVAGATTVLWALTLNLTAGKLSLVTLVAAMSSRAWGLIFLVDNTPWTPVAIYAGFTMLILWAWPRAMLDIELGMTGPTVIIERRTGQRRAEDRDPEG